jgi:hypothetical protein
VLFLEGGSAEKPDYRSEIQATQNPDGTVTERSKFLYPDGQEAMTETLILQGKRVVRYEYDQKQVEEKILMTTADGKFTLVKEFYGKGKEGKTETATEDYGETTLIAAQIHRTIVERWKSLVSGEDYGFRLILPERLDTFGFKLSYDGLQDLNGKKVHRMALSPTSFIIRLVAGSIFFYFEDSESRPLLEVKGILPVKKKQDDGTWGGVYDGFMRIVK